MELALVMDMAGKCSVVALDTERCTEEWVMEAAGARSMAVAGARNTAEVMDEDTDVDPAEAGTDRSLVRESFISFEI